MTLAVFYRRAARHEFDDAADWYEARSPGLGAEFVYERSITYAADRANGGLYVLEYIGKQPLN